MTESFIELECFEPAGARLEFGRDDLLGHSLALGGSGSGKTTRFVLPMIRRLILSHERVGLVILDTKADGQMAAAVRNSASEAGRLDDLAVVDGTVDHTLDIFGDRNSFGIDDVDTLTALLGSLIPRDLKNLYWENTFEALIRQALRLMILKERPRLDYQELVSQIIHYLLLHRLQDPVYRSQVDRLKSQREFQKPATQFLYDEVIATHRMWDTLDARTRSNLQSMAASLTGPMNAPLAHCYFSGGKAKSIAEAVDEEKILLVSIDGIRHAKVARLVACIVKGRFYEAILRRSPSGVPPLAGLILDDWPTAVTGGWGNLHSDVEALSMIRSRGGFLITSAQSLSSLDSIIGVADRRAALANFANLVFFRGRDTEVDLIAASYLGERKDRLIDTSHHDRPKRSGRIDYPVRHEREIRVPAVPVGALARLATGEAYALIGPEVHSQPLCLIPHDSPY
jgi:type IV secretory pathway TraG/TraD family ATPase VirD4